MKRVDLGYAETHLQGLIGEALEGEEIVIAREGVPLVRLEALPTPREPRVFGRDSGQIVMSDDFDDPMPEIEALFYGADDPS